MLLFRKMLKIFKKKKLRNFYKNYSPRTVVHNMLKTKQFFKIFWAEGVKKMFQIVNKLA